MDPKYYFHVADGTVLKTYEDLVEALKKISDPVFSYHVNSQKNDFYNWIKDSIRNYEVAEAIKNIQDRKSLIVVLEQLKKQKILVFNAGSSSLKYQLIDAETETSLIKGFFDAIGKKHSAFNVSVHGQSIEQKVFVPNHAKAVELALKSLISFHVIKSPDEVDVIAHRVVHGGEEFVGPTVIDDDVIKKIEGLSDIAPLHNPVNLLAIKACRNYCSKKKQIAVFDTAFHSTIPNTAFLYGLPFELYKKYRIRKYGFHGISHSYVSKKAAELLDKEEYEMITCHLGAGSSITAIKDGKSVDTSMGFTPLDGLIMGTRSGDIDPEIVLYLIKKHYSLYQLENLLNNKSGLVGLTGYSDMREVRAAALKGDKMAQLAIDMLAYRISLFIGSYMTILHGLDCIVFTGGIGENAWYLREKVCDSLKYAGLRIDRQKNEANQLEISSPDSSIKVFVIPTNEELEIVRQIMCCTMDMGDNCERIH